MSGNLKIVLGALGGALLALLLVAAFSGGGMMGGMGSMMGGGMIGGSIVSILLGNYPLRARISSVQSEGEEVHDP